MAPISTQHQTCDARLLDGVKFGHQVREERDTFRFVKERNPIFLPGLFVHHANGVRMFLRTVLTCWRSFRRRRGECGAGTEPVQGLLAVACATVPAPVARLDKHFGGDPDQSKWESSGEGRRLVVQPQVRERLES